MSAGSTFAPWSFWPHEQLLRFPGSFSVVILLVSVVLSVNGGSAFAHGASPSARHQEADTLTSTLVTLSAQHRRARPTDQAQIESQLLATATARYQLLASLIEDDPAEVLRVALPAALRAALPSAVKAYVEAEVDVEGVLEILHEDRHTGSRYLYFLSTAAERLSLHFTADPPELLTGSRVRARGIRVNSTLALGSGKGGSVQTVSSAVVNPLGEQ